MTEPITITLAEAEVGQAIRPIPGTYKARMTRTERKRGTPATVSFGEEWAGSKFAKITRIGESKRPAHYDVGLANGRTWSAYPGTVKLELKLTAAQRRKGMTTHAEAERKVARKAKVTQTEGDAQNAPTTKRARTRTPVDNDLAAQVKKLRDDGMAWWRIGVELSLPGAGPLPAGKRGAGQARKLYKAASGGTLPQTPRANGGKRNMPGKPKTAAQRRRNAIGLDQLSAAELKERVEGRTITYRYSKPELGEADPVKVAKVKSIRLIGKDEKLAVTFWSERSKEGYSNERTVYAEHIVQVS
jgi:hypothetical protein